MLRDGRAVCHMNALHAAIRFQVIPSPLRTTAYSMDVCIAGLLSVASTPLARPALLVCSESQGCEALACTALTAPATLLSLLSAWLSKSFACTLAPWHAHSAHWCGEHHCTRAEQLCWQQTCGSAGGHAGAEGWV